jgi:hypothetical protein
VGGGALVDGTLPIRVPSTIKIGDEKNMLSKRQLLNFFEACFSNKNSCI